MQQYLRDMLAHFESVRAIRDTQTPVGLRLFCFALIHVSPILLAPYWNNFCFKQVGAMDIPPSYGCASGYFVGVFYVLIVLTLYRVQVELEDPFDGDGMDDIKWEFFRAQLDQVCDCCHFERCVVCGRMLNRCLAPDAPWRGSAQTGSATDHRLKSKLKVERYIAVQMFHCGPH